MKHRRNLRVAVNQRQGDEEEDEARQRVVARRGGLRRKSGHDYISSTSFHMAGKWEILINYKQIRFPSHCPSSWPMASTNTHGLTFGEENY